MISCIGCSAWEFMQSNPEQQANFNAAMRDLSASMTPAVTASYDWSKFPVIADIGGGIGAQLSSILDAHPSCRGILFDQPHVVAESPVHDRMERVGGDFFREIPVQADAYLMRWIIHDWADDKAIAILEEREKGRTARCSIGACGMGTPRDGRFGCRQVDGHQYAGERGRARAHGLRVPDFVRPGRL